MLSKINIIKNNASTNSIAHGIIYLFFFISFFIVFVILFIFTILRLFPGKLFVKQHAGKLPYKSIIAETS